MSRKGEIVRVKTRRLVPELDGVYQLKKVRRFSGYPYRVEHNGELILLEGSEVHSLGDISEAKKK